MPILDPNHRLTPLEKCQFLEKYQFFDFLNFVFLYSRKAFFFFLEYHKRHFPGLYCLKKDVGKMAVIRPKPWVKPFEKRLPLRLFELLFFIAYKGFFSFYNIIKDILLAYIARKKNLKKWPSLDQNHRLNSLEKCQFFDSLNFLFFIA